MEVPTAVVDVKEYKGGQLFEHTLNYYAQDKEENVCYLGERVDDIVDGEVHGGRRPQRPVARWTGWER